MPGAIGFRGFSFDPATRELRRAGAVVDLARKPSELLAHLVAHRDRVVAKSELLDALWPGITVSDDALTSALRDVRRALGGAGDGPVIATVRGRGYRFVAAVGDAEPRARDPFVGRAAALRRLSAALGDAIAGATRISLLAGPPGIGKTRLALEVAADARAADAARTLGGAFAEARTAAEALFVRDAARNLGAAGTLAAQRIAIAVRQGRAEEAIALLEVEAVRRPVWTLTRATLGAMYLEVGRRADARRELDRIARDDFASLAPDHTWLGSILFLADLCLAFGEAERARSLYRRALPFQDMIAAPHLATTCDGAVARGLGVLAHAMGDHDAAARQFERALEIERRLASPPLVAATLVRQARLLLDRAEPGDHDRARRAIDEAAAIAAAHELRLPLAELRAALDGRRTLPRAAQHRRPGAPSLRSDR